MAMSIDVYAYYDLYTVFQLFFCLIVKFAPCFDNINLQVRHMQANRVFFSDQNLNVGPFVQGTNVHYEQLFKSFLHSFTRQNTRLYQKRLKTQIAYKKNVLPVQLADLRNFDVQLYQKLAISPLQTLRLMEKSVRSYLKEYNQEYPQCEDMEWQVVLRSDDHPVKIRDIKSHMISKLFVVSGIIISATKPFIKASRLKIQCKSCNNVKYIQVQPGHSPYVPSYCDGQQGHNQKCPKDPYVAMPESEVIDSQNLKIQEFPEDVPTSEVARTYGLVVDRRNVSMCVPGDRVRLTGVMLVNDLKTQHLTKGYMYVMGIQKMKDRTEITYTQQEQTIFKQMSNDPELPQKIYRSIAPGICGHEEIKKSIACMLFGGSRKHLPDQTVLRGDINVLLLGDPSTAKSQFLKFVEQAASIAVYTSGKGSSAAGLTASITKDQASGQFQIEGGALVLADGGIVCIDQFDKMKSTDRVAIHEAMEQQTISVAKAGITTRLNSRTSILAAANPIFGRMDQFKDVQEQVALQTTILSRFDSIFIVRDINNPETNQKIASHILNMHQGKSVGMAQGQIPFQQLKKYIKYARNKVSPRLSALASEKLINIYADDRQKALDQKKLKNTKNSIPVTVRQLQAVIRLSESLARMKLKMSVDIQQVQTAHYLFTVSTMKAIQGGREMGIDVSQGGAAEELLSIENMIRKRICMGSEVSLMKLRADLATGKVNQAMLDRALSNMVRNAQLQQKKGGKTLMRVK